MTISSADMDFDLPYLSAELARLDVRLRRAVIRWQRAGQDPSDAFRGLYVSDEQAANLLGRPLGMNWGETRLLSAEEAREFDVELASADEAADRVASEVRRASGVPRLQRVAEAFDLDRFELDVLLLCLAPSLDLRYERLFGYLQDDVTRKTPGVSLALEMLMDPGLERISAITRFHDDAPLLRHELVRCVPRSDGGTEGILGRSLVIDETVTSWLLGAYRPHPDLRPHARLEDGESLDTDRLLAGEAEQALASALNALPLVSFYGPDRASQDAAARMLAAKLERQLLRVDLSALARKGVPTSRALRLALRDARLLGGIAYLVGWGEGDQPPEDLPPHANPELMRSLYLHPDVVVLSGMERWLPRGAERDRRVVQVDFPLPDYRRRRAIWAHFVDQAMEHGEVDFSVVAGHFQLASGQIRDAVASARDRAALGAEQLATEHLMIAAREHSIPNLGKLAARIEPRFTWEDIVLPDDQLALLGEIVDTVRERPRVLDDWGVGRKLASSRGVTVLFAGPPGTGKTMAAGIISRTLGLELFKIDLSTVVSKYIGETEKNLASVFSEAESSNAILFFDEADALFGKRSEVRDSHDRYANVEISYLLQQMEAYDGLTVLATNLRANLDEAFTRRLQFAVDFPFPEEEDRLRIWRTLFPVEVPRAADIDFGVLARRYKLAGGNIRNIIVGAAFLAAADGGAVTMEHLLHGTRRELQKMGRLVGEEDLAR
jgi:ATP-dependent 26S proteasome regulatory subunit